MENNSDLNRQLTFEEFEQIQTKIGNLKGKVLESLTFEEGIEEWFNVFWSKVTPVLLLLFDSGEEIEEENLINGIKESFSFVLEEFCSARSKEPFLNERVEKEFWETYSGIEMIRLMNYIETNYIGGKDFRQREPVLDISKSVGSITREDEWGGDHYNPLDDDDGGDWSLVRLF